MAELSPHLATLKVVVKACSDEITEQRPVLAIVKAYASVARDISMDTASEQLEAFEAATDLFPRALVVAFSSSEEVFLRASQESDPGYHLALLANPRFHGAKLQQKSARIVLDAGCDLGSALKARYEPMTRMLTKMLAESPNDPRLLLVAAEQLDVEPFLHRLLPASPPVSAALATNRNVPGMVRIAEYAKNLGLAAESEFVNEFAGKYPIDDRTCALTLAGNIDINDEIRKTIIQAYADDSEVLQRIGENLVDVNEVASPQAVTALFEYAAAGYQVAKSAEAVKDWVYVIEVILEELPEYLSFETLVNTPSARWTSYMLELRSQVVHKHLIGHLMKVERPYRDGMFLSAQEWIAERHPELVGMPTEWQQAALA